MALRLHFAEHIHKVHNINEAERQMRQGTMAAVTSRFFLSHPARPCASLSTRALARLLQSSRARTFSSRITLLALCASLANIRLLPFHFIRLSVSPVADTPYNVPTRNIHVSRAGLPSRSARLGSPSSHRSGHTSSSLQRIFLYFAIRAKVLCFYSFTLLPLPV